MMTNGEKYKDDIIDEYQNLLKEKVVDSDGNRMNRAIKEIAYKYCGMRLAGASSTFKWLFEEYKEPPIKLTRLEHGILEYLFKNKQYKFIVRERNDWLYIYKSNPKKEADSWQSLSMSCGLGLFNGLFEFVTWEDEKPTSIKEVLDNCVVKEDKENNNL